MLVVPFGRFIGTHAVTVSRRDSKIVEEADSR